MSYTEGVWRDKLLKHRRGLYMYSACMSGYVVQGSCAEYVKLRAAHAPGMEYRERFPL